ncbi:MAG: hypothetical protein EXR14_06795 [Pelagibacteraceae bacterium]|nr:hypothetical protein [Pelagibacteraceae bacterium]
MTKKRFKKKERGFALVVAILLLVVMTIMGSTLVALVSNDFKENDRRDYYQQALYAAETGITQAKFDLQSLATSGMPTAQTTPWSGWPAWCSASRFNKLDKNKVYLVKNLPIEVKINTQIISSDTNEDKKYQRYSYYYFITNTPDISGDSKNIKVKSVSTVGSVGSNIGESSQYKSQGSSTAQLYSIFSCARGEDDTVVALDVVVLLKK